MVKYPHIVTVVIASDSQMVNGQPVSGTTSQVSYKCMYRPNTSAKTLKMADGETVVYRGTCYVDAKITDIKTGDKITVESQGIFDMPVLQVYNAQFRIRIIL